MDTRKTGSGATRSAIASLLTCLLACLPLACTGAEQPAGERMAAPETAGSPNRPNVILIMADDLGFGDTGFNGHPVLMTPNLDVLATRGMRFDRFYAAAPVCSPTRASVVTGRHPRRMGIDNPNTGALPQEELTIAELARELGYRTAHFGKWHLGTLTHAVQDSNRGAPGNTAEYSPPWAHGYDVVFATEAKVPTFDPMDDPEHPGEYFGTAYWTGPGQSVPANDMSLWGDDSRVLMDRVIPFIEQSVTQGRRFFATLWLHAPHDPVIADPADRTYADHDGLDEAQRTYYTIVTRMDREIGRLMRVLDERGIAADTLVAFTSDNGASERYAGSNGDLRGFKQDLYEGGIRVPGLLVWPGRIPAGGVSDVPAITHDYLPTLMEIWGLDESAYPAGRPLDGRSLMPVVRGEDAGPRQLQFAFTRWDAADEGPLPQRMALIEGQRKLLSHDYGESWQLYDLAADRGERVDLAAAEPGEVQRLRDDLLAWFEQVGRNPQGRDQAP
jgi:arylsulfatase A-like enzyme